ncbi:MAG: aspartate carbamoyltransferase regulatory subunit [Alloprevotella sp.]
MKNEELKVAAIENGTVIDHIPSSKLFEVINLLRLQDVRSPSSIMVGYNLVSRKMGHKSLIKISNKYFSDEELNRLAVVTPNVTLCIIRNFEVVEKKKVTLPPEIHNIVKCPNPKCITNNEPMPTIFHVVPGEEGVVRCHYCEKELSLDKAGLLPSLSASEG